MERTPDTTVFDGKSHYILAGGLERFPSATQEAPLPTKRGCLPLKVLAYIHGYPPTLCAGAERMVQTMLEHLVSKGHECAVLLTERTKPYELGGVKVSNDLRLLEWCDVIITHLGTTSAAIMQALRLKKPCIHIVHNTTRHSNVAAKFKICGVIFNNEYSKNTLNYFGNKSCVVYPPVRVSDYLVSDERKAYVTLINCNANKGGAQLVQLARMMPDVQFLGIHGYYEAQEKTPLPNLTYLPPQSTVEAMREVYARTKILIMPSAYESWGRTAIEACSSGIPVIANPTFGLKESLAYAGIFCERNDLQLWENQIRTLLSDNVYYAEKSEIAKRRAAELSEIMDRQLTDFEELLFEMSKGRQITKYYEKFEHDMTEIKLIRNITYNGEMLRRGSVVTLPTNVAMLYIGKNFAEIHEKPSEPIQPTAAEQTESQSDNIGVAPTPKRRSRKPVGG